jgi:16S rRNA processing protein RimM
VWVHQVIGAEVRDVRGIARGRCLSVIANPANDLLELDSGALVPVNFVTSVTSDDGVAFTVVVDPPEGLFELFASPSAGPQ